MFIHETVLKAEAIDSLQINPGGIYVDCTLGGAGHSSSITERLDSTGMLIGLDQDRIALQSARERLGQTECQLHLLKSNFKHLGEVVRNIGISAVDGILFDLGVSSPQLDQGDRGFSYHQDAPLDMRMDEDQKRKAYHVVNEWSETEIARILKEYGEERFAKRIAWRIVKEREKQKIETTLELATIIKNATPHSSRWTGTHPARRSFQAIRIAVNDELSVFESALTQAMDLLHPGGRLCVITFHSLEDRICKKFFLSQSKGCICDTKIPICICNNKPCLKMITRKPIVPTEKEIDINKRARSAKLRVAEKI